MMKHAQEIPPSLLAVRHDLQPTFEQIVQRALAKNPAQRFQTAEEFSSALSQASEGVPLAPREIDTIVQPRAEAASAATNATDARWRTAFIVLAGISLLSVGLFYFTQNRRTMPATDPNSSPVMPINPATGAPEQNLSPDFANMQLNTNLDANISTVPPAGTVTDVPYGGRIPPGIYQNYPQGMIDPNSNTQFMPPLDGQVPPPSPTPKTSPKPSVSPSPASSPEAASPTPQTSPKATPQTTPAPATPNPANSPKPTPPARTPPVPKPTQPSTEKSAQNLSDRISKM
jgi:hypothetical protein